MILVARFHVPLLARFFTTVLRKHCNVHGTRLTPVLDVLTVRCTWRQGIELFRELPFDTIDDFLDCTCGTMTDISLRTYRRRTYIEIN